MYKYNSDGFPNPNLPLYRSESQIMSWLWQEAETYSHIYLVPVRGGRSELSLSVAGKGAKAYIHTALHIGAWHTHTRQVDVVVQHFFSGIYHEGLD